MMKRFKLFLFVLHLLLIHPSSNGQPTDLIVKIPNGSIRGSSMTSASGRQFVSFRGIPYAIPPVGNFRFKDPVAAEPWGGVYDGTHEGPFCVQYHFFARKLHGKEDCLALNVYTHEAFVGDHEGDIPEEKLRPVLFWIHGGGWFMGSGNGETDFFGPDKIMDQDVVLVTINYRLGPFGFLSTEDEESPGNYGLLDQTLALKWVQNNIRYFGGNPKLVTIFGQSSGGASVHYHMLSPESKGLFQRAIVQSGSALCPWAIMDDLKKPTYNLASKLQCPTSSSRQLLACLRKRSAEEILSNITYVSELDTPMVLFGPRVDSERSSPFLPKTPGELIEKGNFYDTPLIIGVNRNESAIFVAAMLNKEGKLTDKFKKDPITSLNHLLVMQNKFNNTITEDVVREAAQKYLKNNESLDQQLSLLEQMLSDYQIFNCVDDTVNLHIKYGTQPVYYYYFNHRGENTASSLFGAPKDVDLGVAHGDEVLLMFNNRIMSAPQSAEDILVGNTLIQLWTSFATKGKPDSNFVSGDWKPASSDEMRYLKIDSQSSVITGNLPHFDRLQFWKNATNPPVSGDWVVSPIVNLPFYLTMVILIHIFTR